MTRRKKPIDKLTDWEWITLVAAWRHYENSMTIVSVTFPFDIIERFFRGAYSERICKQIANQFAVIDHGIRGEEDWARGKCLRDCDRLAWVKFFRFCQGYVTGFHKVALKNGSVSEEVDAFHVDWNDRWYPVDRYTASPRLEQFCAPEYIVSIDGKPYKKGKTK